MRPELLTRIGFEQAARYILDEQFWIQEKWDAERLLVQRSGREIRGWNKQGADHRSSSRVDVCPTFHHGERLHSGWRIWTRPIAKVKNIEKNGEKVAKKRQQEGKERALT